MQFKDGLIYARRAKNYIILFVIIIVILFSYHNLTGVAATSSQQLSVNKQSSANQQSTETHKAYSSFTLSSQLALGLKKKIPLQGKTIVLDPGHGGKDEGTTGINGIDEKVLTFKTALIVAKKLKKAGATVFLTRNTDQFITLSKRVIIAEKYHADAFISMHYNFSVSSSINGITGFYYHNSKDYQLASSILKSVVKATGFKDRGVRYGDLHVLRENSQPATLIELGFLSNQHDDHIVQQDTYRKKVAEGIYNGLINYFNSNNIRK